MVTSTVSMRGRLWGTAVSAIALIVTIAILGALTPGFGQWRDTVSRLGSPGERFALEARASFVVYGVLAVLGAAPLGRLAPGRDRLLSLLVGTFGTAAIVTGVAPKDQPGHPHTVASQVHVDATLIGGLAIITAMVVVARLAPRRVTRQTAAVSAPVCAALAVAFRFAWGSPVYGLIERALLLVTGGWTSLLAATALGATSDAATRQRDRA